MNKIFNVIWSKTKETWIVVSERVKTNGGVPKSPLKSLALLAAMLLAGAPAYGLDPGALPGGGQVTAGSATIGVSGTQMTVNQSSQQMIANWNSFNIGANAGVRFNQPNSAAGALNRISGQSPSQIMGSLSSNGQVFLLNPSGIIFGKTSRVDVGGLVASSLSISDSDFLAGKNRFFNTGGNAGSVLNQGVINAMPGGVVALIAPKVSNEGSITADGGSVALAAGKQVSLDFKGDGLITLTVDQAAVDAEVSNSGLLQADGGMVVMTTRSADALVGSVVNNSGIVRARGMVERNGEILIDAGPGGTAEISGTLDASAPDGGDGGFIETSGASVKVLDGTTVTTLAPLGKNGIWLIDPAGYTIASSGGDISGTTLSSNLAGGNISLSSTDGSGSDGNINVNDTVTWSAHELKLTATKDVNINAAMNVNGTATLDLEPGSGNVNVGMNAAGTSFTGAVNFASSGTGLLTINGNAYTLISRANYNDAMSGSSISSSMRISLCALVSSVRI